MSQRNLKLHLLVHAVSILKQTAILEAIGISNGNSSRQAKQHDLAEELGGRSGIFALPEAVLVLLLQHCSFGGDLTDGLSSGGVPIEFLRIFPI